jgi:hypothetical protein
MNGKAVITVFLLGGLFIGGCAADECLQAPHGPGATATADLAPWLTDAQTVTFTGRLQYFHCTSENGNFWTWSIDPAGDDDAAEVDVRACPDVAHRLEDRRVTITGKLIPREPNHFPILVAERIVPASDDVLVDASR